MTSATRASLTVAILLFAGAVMGQGSGQPAPEPLAGPKVAENKIPGVQEKFGGSGKGFSDKNGPRGIPPEAIKRALRALDRDDTPADARLSDDQRSKIKALVADFEASVADYKAVHKAEIDEVRKVLGKDGAALRREAPKPKSTDDSMRADADPDRVAAARAQMEELRRGAPSAADLQTQIWNLLSEPQHAAVQAEVTRLIKAREDEKARDYVRKRMDKKGGSGDRGEPALKADGTVDMQTLAPRVKERLENMTPQERERAVRKIRERIKNGGSGGRAGRGESLDKPMPSMDEVPVPSSEEEPRP